MSWDPWEPVGGKKKNSFFEPVTFNSGGESSWGYSSSSQSATASKSHWAPTDNSSTSSWAFSSGTDQKTSHWAASPTSNASSWAFSSNPGDQRSSHWGHQQGYGFGHTAFCHESRIQRMEEQRGSWWGSQDDGSAWHFSSAAKDLDLFHEINNSKQRLESNSDFARSWGWSSSNSHFQTSSFNPFSGSSAGSSWSFSAPSQPSSSSTGGSFFAPSDFNPFSSSSKKKGWGWE